MSALINKETGAKIADVPEELPPLREGYVRLIHQTHFTCAESLAENGLVYNREYAQKTGGGKYSDITSMAVAYTKEDDFWDRLTHEEIRHRSADAVAVFDMPLEECSAHQKVQIAQYLNGTISRGYMVGIIPNYGTKNSETQEKLSVSEMEEKKKISRSNPLPPSYETPDWRKNIDNARENFEKQQENIDYNWKGDNKAPEVLETFDFDDWGTSQDTSKTPDTSQKTETFEFDDWGTSQDVAKMPDISPKTDFNENNDYLAYKLQYVRKKLSYKNLDKEMGKTGNDQTQKVSEQPKEVAKVQTETTKTSPLRFKHRNLE